MKLNLIVLALLLPQFVLAEQIVGKLTKLNGQFFLDQYQIETSKQIQQDLDEVVVYNNRYIRADAEIDREKLKLKLNEMPTEVSGRFQYNGQLILSGSNKLLFLPDTNYVSRVMNARLDNTKQINGFEFDQLSLDSYLNKNVVINANYDSEKDELVITAVVDANVLKDNNLNSDGINKPKEYALKDIYKNSISKQYSNMKFTIVDESVLDDNESGLFITESGRQGDDLKAGGGHFAIGRVQYNDNGRLIGEVFNFYPRTNEKLINPVHVDIVDYFGHLIQGQLNFRPTYSLILWGVGNNKIEKARSEMEKSQRYMRQHERKVDLKFNCTTEAVKALKEIGIVGPHEKVLRKIFDVRNILKPLELLPSKSKAGQLAYGLLESSAKYLPRNAFDSILKNLPNVKRADYLFIAQNESLRPIGGAPVDSLFKLQKLNSVADKKGSSMTMKEISEAIDRISE